ncbi:MAG: WD40/YVTN/BNR-like repeat-containing protein [Janthinobacterium lividum]
MQVLDAPALIVRNPLVASYQTVTRAGPRLVAGGEHGLIILSDDNGVTWRQAKVPVSAAILTIRFATPQSGWAIGAFGVVLHTADGGVNWVTQLDGIKTAAIMVAQAQAASSTGTAATAPAATTPTVQDPATPAAVPQRLRRALSFKNDGPDKPFLVLQVTDAEHARVLGAYDMAFETADGGGTWTEWDGRIDDPRDLHPYGIAGNGASTIVVGEQGLLVKGDPAVGMKAITSPYDGSFFGAIDGGKQGLFMFGLLGHLYHSADGGSSWSSVDNPSKATLTCGLVLGDGQIVFGDMQGSLWRLSSNTLTRSAAAQSWPITDMAEAVDGSIIISGLGGLARIGRNTFDKNADAAG